MRTRRYVHALHEKLLVWLAGETGRSHLFQDQIIDKADAAHPDGGAGDDRGGAAVIRHRLEGLAVGQFEVFGFQAEGFQVFHGFGFYFAGGELAGPAGGLLEGLVEGGGPFPLFGAQALVAGGRDA